VSPYISGFCVNSEDGLEALRERGELRTVAKVEKMIVSKQKIGFALIDFDTLLQKLYVVPFVKMIVFKTKMNFRYN